MQEAAEACFLRGFPPPVPKAPLITYRILLHTCCV
jgi:hypothetical protein